MSAVEEQAADARNRIAVAAGAALLVAGLVLVMFVLPAEFAVDPLGIGTRIGLLDLGVTGKQIDALNAAATKGGGNVPTIVPGDKAFHQETVVFTVAPDEGLEYKYRLEKGRALLFTWSATAPVEYEAHAEPDGAPAGYAESYEKGVSGIASGTLTAPFSGIHGWYWKNTTNAEVTLTLSTAGFYNLAHEFRAGQPVKNKSF